MKQISELKKYIVPAAAVVIGLIIGLGLGQLQIKKEQRVFQEKIKEANKKIAFIQRKMVEEKAEATAATEQKCRSDLDLLQKEKDVQAGQLGKLKDQTHSLEAKIDSMTKEAEAVSVRTKKELQEAGQKYAQAARHNKDLEDGLKKVTGEKGALQAELKKTTRNLDRCETNNANLCIIAEELVKAYRNKGIGASILEKEPLTQIRKVELEQLTQKYREDIEQQKIRKK